MTAASSVWDAVIGQSRAIAQLTKAASDPVHAYLFHGPAGCTKEAAALSFAALLLSGVDDPSQRDARLVLSGDHPDVRAVERQGASISAPQVSEIIRTAWMAPVEGDRQVLILHEFHLLESTGAARLLKTLEEPPAGTVFIVLADQVSPELVTIASRCVRIDFAALDVSTISQRLQLEGADAGAADEAAQACGGSLDRARILVADPELRARRELFAGVPKRLDGTGNTVVTVVAEILARIEAAAAPLAERHAQEVTELEARIAAAGERGSGRKQLEDRHKRELRRHRTDEIRSGLAVLASTYRDALVEAKLPRPEAAVAAVARIHTSIESLERNPNEGLLLQALLLDLPTV